MAENDLVESLRRIEGIFEPDQAVIHVHAEGNNVLIEGNRDGLLSVAISLLHAAATQPSSRPSIPHMHSNQVKQVLGDADDLFFLGAVHRTDDQFEGAVEYSQKRSRWTDRTWLVGCAMAVFLLAMILLGGLIFWIRLLTTNPHAGNHGVQFFHSRVGHGSFEKRKEPKFSQTTKAWHRRIGDMRSVEIQPFQSKKRRQFRDTLVAHGGVVELKNGQILQTDEMLERFV